MSRKQYSVTKQLAVAVALALGASGVAVADDSSMSRFGGDSYAYFNQPARGNTAGSPRYATRLSERELQVLSSSGVGAAWQLDRPVFASASADPTWRQSHPNGLTERELQELSSSTLAAWQVPNGSGAATVQSNVAQSARAETSLARK